MSRKPTRPLPGFAERLRLVRKYTGDKFSVARGYSAAKPMSKARQRTVERYARMILELTSRPHIVRPIPKGTKGEAFEYTGQKGFPRFTKIILATPDASHTRYRFHIDRTRPKGSRFVVTNLKSGERTWHIPAEAFGLTDFEGEEDEAAAWFSDVIRDYTPDDTDLTYMIQAGESFMWGDIGTPDTVGEKLAQLRRNYSAGVFDAFDPNSHYIGNWFAGVSVYQVGEASALQRDRVKLARAREEKWGLQPGEHWREGRNGTLIHFYKGEIRDIFFKTSEGLVATKDFGVIKPKGD